MVAMFVGAPVAGAQPGVDCGLDQGSAVATAIAHTPHDPITQVPWNPNPVGGSNYDACADLSAVVVTIDNPRPTSPRQAFLFHRGNFVGTATTHSRPYTTLDMAASTKDMAVLVFTSGRTCPTCNDGTSIPVRYKWNGVTVVMMDPIPPPQTWP